MAFNLKKAFRHAVAIAVLGMAGAGAGSALYRTTHGRVDAHTSPAETAAVQKYEARLAAIGEEQAALDSTTDEDAAIKLEKRKKNFIADVVLDSTLSETDVGALAKKFNAQATDDGIAFRFAASDLVRQRNECLADIVLTKDRIETATRVEECMFSYQNKDEDGAKVAATAGGVVGAAMGGTFLLGFAAGRRRRKDDPGA